jgi:hypothetical protein
MKPRVKKMNWFVRLLTANYLESVTIAPFGIYSKNHNNNNNKIRINKSKIRWAQQIEMYIIFYYLWYFIEWTMRIPTDKINSFKNLSMEKEVDLNMNNLEYLKTRKRFAWTKYLIRYS